MGVLYCFETMVSILARQTGGIISEGAASWWHWRGRPVRLVDGATVTLADTEENQAAYPQSNSQKEGLGFTICRVAALLCLGSGALLDAAMGPCKGKGGDEQALLRDMLDSLDGDDILLGDAFYATYFLLWELLRGGVDGLFEQHGARKRSTNFRGHLGTDHVYPDTGSYRYRINVVCPVMFAIGGVFGFGSPG